MSNVSMKEAVVTFTDEDDDDDDDDGADRLARQKILQHASVGLKERHATQRTLIKAA